MSITVQNLVTELGFKVDNGKIDGYNSRVSKASAAMGKAQAGAQALARGVAVFTAAAVAATTAAFALVKQMADIGDQAAKDAQRYGVSAERLQELGHAAKLSGADMGALKVGFRTLARGLEEVNVKGAGPATDALKALGVAIDDPILKSQDMGEVAEGLADHFAKMEDGPKKTAAAMALFSESGAAMIPFLNQGSKGIAEMRKEFRDLGAVITNDQARASEEFNDQIERMKAGLLGVKVTIASELMPIFRDAINRTLEWIKANKDLIAQKVSEWLKRIIPFVQRLATFFGNAATVIGQVIDRLGGLDKALTLAAGALAGMKVASMAALGPIGLVGGAFLALLPLAMQVGDRLGVIAFNMSNIGQESARLMKLHGGRTFLRGRAARISKAQSSFDQGGQQAATLVDGMDRKELLATQQSFTVAEGHGEEVTEYAKLLVATRLQELEGAEQANRQRVNQAVAEQSRRSAAGKAAAEAAKSRLAGGVGISKFNTNLGAIGDAYESRRFDELLAEGMSVQEASNAAVSERHARERDNFGLSEQAILSFDPEKSEALNPDADPLATLTGGKLTSGRFGTGERPGFGTQVVNFHVDQTFNTDISVEANGISGETTTGDIEESMRTIAQDVLGAAVKSATLEVLPSVER